jgi:hypothetical protein
MQSITAAIFAAIIGYTLAAPTPTPSGESTINHKTLSLYTVWTGAIEYGAHWGNIFKDGRSSDVTTLLTFDIPADTQGKTCSFHLSLDSSSAVQGTGQFDVFTSLAPVTQSTTTWPSGSVRDQYFGRMQAYDYQEATYVEGFPNKAHNFPCPYGQLLAIELVGTGDIDLIEWNGPTIGPYLSYQ